MQLKPGTRLRSRNSDVAVVVVSARREAVVECGGLPMVAHDADASADENSTPEGTTLLGKRYVDDSGEVELLCTKGGAGALGCDGVPMTVKDAKALPSSD